MLMTRDYVRESGYHPDEKKLRDLLSQVTYEQKLNILQETKNRWVETALHEAARRGDAEMITTILSSLQSEDRLKLLMLKECRGCTPLQKAAHIGNTKSVKAILNSLTADHQMQLLTAEDEDGETAVESASGKTADVLIRYSVNAIRRVKKGKIPTLLKLCVHHLAAQSYSVYIIMYYVLCQVNVNLCKWSNLFKLKL